MSEEIFIYWGSGSVPCWRIQIVLEEKNIRYGNKMLSFDKNEHKNEDILKLNPRGQLPTIKLNDSSINDSVAASLYFENKYKLQGCNLLPDEKLAIVLQRAFEALNLQKICNENIIYYIWRTSAEKIDAGYLSEKKKELRKELDRWEQNLSQEGYMCGSNFTLADVFFFTHLAFAVRCGYAIDRHPKLSTYYKILSARESIKSTWPPHWKTSTNSSYLSDT